MTRALLPALALLGGLPAQAAEDKAGPIRRFALIVGANDGGSERVTLRYAQSDAQAFVDVLTELGGVDPRDTMILREPDGEDLTKALYTLADRVEGAGNARTEVVFYYSGHSDETGLLLRGDRFMYRDIRAGLDNVPADVRIAVVDSCASGALIRTKGGTVAPPFLLDESRVVTGHAYLTSASADEAAQEADRLLGSFFTHSLVTGLRGAADVTGDGRVTLSEAYAFAYDETLRRTENTRFGPQHATRQMDLTGTGELVMTDLSAVDAGVVLEPTLSGRLTVRDNGGRLVAEVTKPAGRPMELGLGQGRYRLLLDREDGRYEARIWLAKGQRTPVSLDAFERMELVASTARGDKEGGPDGPVGTPLRRVPLVSGLVPLNKADVSTGAALTAVAGRVGELRGAALSMGGTLVEGDASGAMTSLAFNGVQGDSRAAQLTLGANWTQGNHTSTQVSLGANVVRRDLRGSQFTLGANVVGERMQGVQVSLGANIAGRDVQGVQASLGANVAAGAVQGIQLSLGGNLAGGPLTGTQVALGTNIAPPSSRGVQLALGPNIAGNHFKGAQVGFINIGQDLNGAQVGLVNVAREVRGTQVGLVNVAKRQSGASVGLVQFVKEGQFHGEVWGGDLFPVNGGVQFGGKRVYTQLQLGWNPDRNAVYPTAGIGWHFQRRAAIPDDPDAPRERDGRVWGEVDFNGGTVFSDLRAADTAVLLNLRGSVGFELNRHLSPEIGLQINGLYNENGQALGIHSLVMPDQFEEEAEVAVWPSIFAGVQF